MSRRVAFLRAINVGGHTVKMDRLRELFESLGFQNVETFIASGNVLFDATGARAPLERRIEAHLRKELGYEVATFIRTLPELEAVLAYEPFPSADDDDRGLYIAFVHEPPGAAVARKLLEARTAVDDFHVNGREIYWLVRGRFSDSQFTGARLEKTIGAPATIRNVTSVRKLVAKKG